MPTIVAIIGRPNVGKSTLFNRLSRSRNALVDDRPGITRDRLYADIRWEGKALTIIDTGGFDESAEEPLLVKVKDQVAMAVDEADMIVFMVDGKQGLMPGDEDIMKVLRLSGKGFFLAANKIDGPEQDHLISEFYRLGVERIHPLSAAHGYGLKTLMTDMVNEVPDEEYSFSDDSAIRVAILGRPNAGKSSLINRILGSERVLVSDIPGTTRDSVDTLYTYKGKEYLLIDTAGIRRKARVKEKIEKFSMIKALKSLDRCHIAVVILDAEAGVAEQDARICGYAFERDRGLVLAINKWDLVKKDPERKKRLESEVDRIFNFIPYTPRIKISALTGERVKTLFGKIDLLFSQFSSRINTGEVNRAIKEMIDKNPPPFKGGGRLKFYYATQTRIKPPSFLVFVNRPDKIHFSYKRFIKNQLRTRFGLDITPIKLIFRKR